MKGLLRIRILLVFAVATALLAGCQKKPKQRDVLEKYREPLEKFRAEIASCGDLLDKELRKPAAPLDPKPVFNFGNFTWSAKEGGPNKSNLCIFPAAALEDLTKVWAHSFSNEIRLDNGLGHIFSLLHGTTSGADDEADSDLDAQVQGLLQTRYLGFFKERKYVPAKMEDGKTFSPGIMGGDVWLVNRSSGKLVFHGVVLARNSAQVSVLHDRMRSLSRGDWESELYKDMKDSFLTRMMLVLTRDAGVEFRNWRPPAPEPSEPPTLLESPGSN